MPYEDGQLLWVRQTRHWSEHSVLPSLCPRAVIADWVFPTPPSLTCPSHSSRLLSLLSAAVSRSWGGGQAGSWLSKEATTSPSLLRDAADLFLLWTLALLVYVVELQVILSYRPTFLLADHNRLGVICLRALFCPLTSSTCRTKWSCLSAGMLKLA